MLSTHSAPSGAGGGKGTGFVGSRRATENPVTRFPPGKVVAPATKGGAAGMVQEEYDAKISRHPPSLPLEGP